MRRRSRLSWVVALAIIAAVFFWHSRILSAMGSYLVAAGAPQKADAALVLAGGADGRRILKAAELVKEGYAPVALISGPGGVYGTYECDLAIPFAVKHGFPESYFVHLEHEAHSTKEEAEDVLPEIRKRGYKRILLVTSNFHTRRATRIFRGAAPDLTFIPVAASDEYFTPEGWWHTRQGEKVFFVEWEKTIASWLGI